MSPQQRSLFTLLGLTAVAAAVGLYAYFGVMKEDEKEQTEKETADKLFSGAAPAAPSGDRTEDGGTPPAPAPQFTRISIRAKGETTVVEKQPDGAWRVTAPVKAPVDQYVLDSVTNQLRDGKVDQKVEEKPSDEDLQRYGLKEPAWTVEATALVEGAARQVKLEGGGENTFNGSIYLRKDADPTVYAASGSIRFNLEKTSYDLRDKQVLAVEEPKLQALDVVRPKGDGFSLVRGEGTNEWKMTRPRAQGADSQTVINVLGQLKSERATAFLADSPEERKKAGLDAPAVDATFTLKDGEKVRIRMAKAGPGPGPQGRAFALREDKDGAVLAEIGAAALGHLDKPAADLRDKSVLQFKRDEVAELIYRAQGGGQAIELKRDLPAAGQDGGSPGAEAWTVVNPEKGPAKAWKVSSNLWTLSSLQATGFGEDSPKSWDKYGINDRSRQVILKGADGKVLATLAVGAEVKGKPNTVYVRGSGGAVLEMDSARLSDLPLKTDDILDKPAPPPVPAPAP